MFAIIAVLILGAVAVCTLLYFISKEIFIREMGELSDYWDFERAKDNERIAIWNIR